MSLNATKLKNSGVPNLLANPPNPMNARALNSSGKLPNGSTAAPQFNANGNPITNANAQKDSKMPMIIIIVVTILLFIFVILYITFAMKSSNLKGKALMTTPIKVDKVDNPIQIPNSEIPKTESGREYAYTFWMYLESFVPEMDAPNNRPLHKLIMYRGNAGDVASANPLIMMDGQTNKLYIIIKTTESSIVSNTVNDNLHEIIANNYFMSNISLENPKANKHLILAVDYIPLQRWVHVGVVVDNKVITLYLDGEIYSVKSTDEFKAARQPHVTRLGKVVPYNLIVEKTDGDLFVGKSRVGNKRTIDGFMGKIEFFNYALSMEQLKKAYKTGPMPTGLLSMLGLGQYGFRSPVYKLNESVQ